MKFLQRCRLDFLANTDELDRLLCDMPDGEGGPASRIAVHFRQDNAVNVQFVIEVFGDVDSILSRHRIDDEQDFCGVHRVLDTAKFAHEFRVNVQTPGGINNHTVLSACQSLFNRGLRNLHR